MEKNNLNIGIIGAGNVSDLHCSAIKKSRLGNLYSVFDIDPRASHELKSQFGELTVFNNFEEMIKDENIDAYAILVPPKNHFSVIRELMEKTSKPIFCEKPLVLDGAHLEEIFKMPNHEKRIFVGQSYRFFSQIIKTKEYFKENINQLRYFEIKFRKHIHKIRPLGGWRSKYKEYVIVDNGIHIIDLLTYLTEKKIKRIFCQGSNTSGVIEGIDTSFINVELEGGIKGIIILEHNNVISNTLYEGKHYYRFNSKTLVLDEEGLIEYEDDKKEIIRKNILVDGPIKEDWLDSFTLMWKTFFRCVQENKNMSVCPKSVRNSVKGVLMAVESVNTGKIIQKK